MLSTGTSSGVKTRQQKATQEEQKVATSTKVSKAKDRSQKKEKVDFAKEIFDMLK